MIGAILEVEDMDYIYMDQLFSNMGEFYLNYNWLISDYDCYGYPSANLPFHKPYVWLTGHELGEVIKNNRLSFIWGAISGFLPDVTLEEVLSTAIHGLPYAEGCENIWKSELQFQHPRSHIEIIAWEATYFIIMSKQVELIDQFRETYPNAEDLRKYNRNRGW